MVTRMADKKPLWEVMRDAYKESDDGTRNDWKMRHGYAAELRALVDEVLPEEPWPQAPPLFHLNERRIEWRQRIAIRAKFLQAAAEAEGES